VTQPAPRPVRLCWPALTAVFALSSMALLLFPLGGCNSGNNPDTPGKVGPIAPSSFAVQWGTQLKLNPRDEVTEVFVRGEQVFAYTKQGISYVLTRDKGAIVRADVVEGGNYKMLPPVVLKERVVYPTTTQLEVFDTVTAQRLLPIDLHAAIRGGAVGEGGSVYVALDSPNGGGRVRKVNLDLTQNLDPRLPSGLMEWELQARKGGIEGAPAVQGAVLYMGSTGGQVYAVSTETREPIWSPATPGPMGENVFDVKAGIYTDIVADDSGVYVPTTEGRLWCLNRNTGQVKWQYFPPNGNPLTTPPVVSADTVYQLDPGEGMVAIDKAENPEIKQPQHTRTPRWKSKDISRVLAQDEQHTYALRKNNALVALDKATGQKRFESRRKDLSIFATNTKDGMLYAATKGGRILAIKAVTSPGEVGETVRGDDAPADLRESVAAAKSDE